MRCSFCGYVFDPNEVENACGNCPLVRDCHLIHCPRCGYEMPPEAKLVRWLRKRRWRAGEQQPIEEDHR
jgi:rubredoxin